MRNDEEAARMAWASEQDDEPTRSRSACWMCALILSLMAWVAIIAATWIALR